MKKMFKLSILASLFICFSCDNVDTAEIDSNEASKSSNAKSANFNVNFQHKATINIGGEGASEITAYDATNKKLFVVNVESKQISVINISNLNNPVEENPIVIPSGSPNSVAVHKGLLAVAVEADAKQDPGFILVFDTKTMFLLHSYQVGALPDMVTFSPNGQFIVSANEGEPNDDYNNDPEGTVSIIEVVSGNITTLNFTSFNGQQAALEADGFRVFGPGASLAMDVEPEYIAISDNSNYAWVTLQENNGIAKVNLHSKQIEAIYPLGYKDHSMTGNELDPSDKDKEKVLNNWPVYGIYMPDAIKYVKINGSDYIITANEGDARDYDGFSEEFRVKDLLLDPTVFPDAAVLQGDAFLGRLKTTNTLGDIDNDGDFDKIFSYGARSFTIWTGDGQMVFDSGSDVARQTLNLTPDRFNDNDGRSDDKGAEPESVEILKLQGNKYLLFVGLERNDQIMVYDISNPSSPQFLNILSHYGDEAPEGLLAIPSGDSPNGKDLLVVSNEDSGTVTIYENLQ